MKPRASTGQSSKASSEAEIVESIALYPIGDRKKIQFTVVGAEIKNGDKSDKSKDCYLTGNYNSRKGQRLRTQIKKTEENRVKWNSGSPPTIISETKKTLEVKLYSKQYFSVNDELIG